MVSDEIQAAHIAARATICAAWIQGWLTFGAGIFALVAGIFAYCGAVRAATRQVQLEERRHAARVVAYRFRIEALTNQLEGLAAVGLGEAMIALNRFRDESGASYSVPTYPLPNFPEFSEQHWEDHALLGQAAVGAIHKVRSNLKEYKIFCNDVAKNNLKSDDYPQVRHLVGPPIEKEDGGVSFRVSNVVEHNEILARNILESIRELQSVLATREAA